MGGMRVCFLRTCARQRPYAFPRRITSPSRSNVLGGTKGSAGRSVKSVADQKQTKRFKHFQMWLKLCISLLVNSNEIIGKLKTIKKIIEIFKKFKTTHDFNTAASCHNVY